MYSKNLVLNSIGKFLWLDLATHYDFFNLFFSRINKNINMIMKNIIFIRVYKFKK